MILEEAVIIWLKTDAGKSFVDSLIKEAKLGRPLAFEEKQDYFYLGKKDLVEKILANTAEGKTNKPTIYNK